MRGPAVAAPPLDLAATPAPRYVEEATWIHCGSHRMLGVLCQPAQGARSGVGVVIAVGGPQYRIGSHRQFVQLARRLAAGGFASLRFDNRGMGDSEGPARTFEQTGDDLAAAIDHLSSRPGVRSIVVWALCDAASAALMFCSANPRVAGLALLNPWARSEATLASTHLKHYYAQRLLERDFWNRVIQGRFDWRASARGLLGSLARLLRSAPQNESVRFQDLMARGWRRFESPILLVLSGRDLTAREFVEYASTDPLWRGLLQRPNVRQIDIAEADHTFSNPAWKAWLEDQTLQWLRGIDDAPAQRQRT
ncbi:MAG TPA: hydrolase 1, exosortase A system-associated [Burkholderiaceae bacterium]|nr:hydrolase 1, exosortase A system-associated [Burkholderiaceae bacterium]